MCRRVRACDVDHVDLYLAESQAEAQESTDTYLFFCDPNSPYWFRVGWHHWEKGDEEDDPFHVEVHDKTEDITVWEDNNIADDDSPDAFYMDQIDEVDSPNSALSQGVHKLRAYARRTTVGEWVESNQCKVNFDGDSGYASDPQPLVPGWGCPRWWGGCTGEKIETDACGNKLKIICGPVGSLCAYQYFYKDKDSTTWEKIGWCPWGGGHNLFYYWWDPDDHRFVKAMHISFNKDLGVDSEGEGCPSYYCFRVENYDCINDSNTVSWRRTTDDCWKPPEPEGWWDETSGVSCPNDTGIHRGHPD
ncbi:MAG: hypothetical protein ACYTEX_02000 [Planctomycetota bacterium]